MDLCSITISLHIVTRHNFNAYDTFISLLAYGFFAFGLQPFFGLLLDKFHITKNAIILGSLLVLISFLVQDFPLFAIVLAGIGSALFHTGSGSIVLNIAPTKATPVGIFTAPGVLGLVTAMVIGTNTSLVLWPFILLLLFSLVFIIVSKIPKINYAKNSAKSNINHLKLIIMLLIFFMIVRSIYGLSSVFAWQNNLLFFYILTLAVVAGKIIGGMGVDRFGWFKITIVTLFISVPLLLFFPTTIALVAVGTFLFSVTMPLPVVALSNMFPGNSAFVFGLSEFFILFQYLHSYHKLNQLTLSLVIIVMAVIAFLFSLKLLEPYFKNKLKINL